MPCRPYRCLLSACLAGMLVMGGCRTEQAAEPDYARPLPAGTWALRKITDPGHWPDVRAAWIAADGDLRSALERSIGWFDAPSSKQFFPVFDVSHTRARTSAWAFRHLLDKAGSDEQFEALLREHFDAYVSVGYDGKGTVLYTGYYSPVFDASRTRTEEYRYPLYRRPADLATEPVTGKPLGKRVGDTYAPYPTRAEIETEHLLEGRELVWLADRLDAYIIHVNGSAKLQLTDGSVMYVGYAGKTDRPYTSVGRALVAAGEIEESELSLRAIRRYFREHPDQLQQYLHVNENFVFFREYDGGNWPAGSIGVKVAPRRTLATDKAVFPRAGVVLADTVLSGYDGRPEPFVQFMLDQDTGGAIRAAGRADIYMGIGPLAELVAGAQYAEGRLYFFFLKQDRVLAWLQRMRDGREESAVDAPAESES